MSKLINKGEQIKCIKTLYLDGNRDQPAYLEGHIYTSERNNSIPDELGNRFHRWEKGELFNIHFVEINKECTKEDKVNHPSHYTWLKKLCGIEVIDITRHMNFNLGNVVKYVLRSGHKSEQGMSDKQKQIEDLKKARFYIDDEIRRLENDKEGI